MRRLHSGTCKAACLSAAALVLLAGGLQPALGQDGVVAGRVLAERSLRPVDGALVVAEGTPLRTTTDASGRFRLGGFDGANGAEVTLAVRRIGFRPLRQTVRAGEQGVRLVLAETIVELDEVVVTGTAEATERRALGNAVTSISAPDVVERGSVSSVQQLINGRAPGVVIQPGSGVVGGGSRITVRGGTSLGVGNAPLLYIDGVRADNTPASGPPSQSFGASAISRINDLDPDEIERVEIIKGPAAATLYGTEASTGVINVITKQGALGPARWQLGVKRGVNYLRDAEGRFPTNYQRFQDTGRVLSIDIVQREKARGTPIFRRGAHQEYDLSVSGGSQQLRYYLAGGYESSDGVEPWNELRKYSGRLNVTLVPNTRLAVTAGVGYAGGPTRLSPEGGVNGRVGNTVFADPRKLPGGGGDTTRRGFNGTLPEEYDLLHRHGGNAEQDLGRLTTRLRAEHQPLSWLRQSVSAGYDRTALTNTAFIPRVDALIANAPFPAFPLGYKEVAVWNIRYQTIDYAATATAEVTPAVRSTASLGGQYYRNTRSRVFSSGKNFPTEGLSSISSTAERETSDTLLEDATLGIFVQEQLAWRDRLFLTAALRVDDNSAFGANFDRVYYPKASASWVVSEEPFFGRTRWVKTLRLRAAYGEAGKQPTPFDALPTYGPISGPSDGPAVTPLSIGNPDLGPERGKELELGFDAALLGDRVGIELTYYDKRTVDAILQRQVAPSLGYPGIQYFNAGKIRNSGVELLARAVPLRGAAWEWDVTFTLATNAGEVVSLGDPAVQFVTAGTYLRHQVGYPPGSWFEKRVVSADMDVTGAVSNVMCDDGQGGSMLCAGPDGNYGTADDAPAVYLGRTLPKTEGALANTLALFGRRLRLYAQVDFKTGHRKLDFNTFNRCTQLGGRCRENFVPTDFDARRIAAVTARRNLVDFVIADASFAKLRELSATYALPGRWAGALRASRASVSLAGRELHTWTRYDGLDPEAMFLGGGRGGNYNAVEQALLPQLSQWLVAVNLWY